MTSDLNVSKIKRSVQIKKFLSLRLLLFLFFRWRATFRKRSSGKEISGNVTNFTVNKIRIKKKKGGRSGRLFKNKQFIEKCE